MVGEKKLLIYFTSITGCLEKLTYKKHLDYMEASKRKATEVLDVGRVKRRQDGA